jgi:hypothetical protein
MKKLHDSGLQSADDIHLIIFQIYLQVIVHAAQEVYQSSIGIVDRGISPKKWIVYFQVDFGEYEHQLIKALKPNG